MGLLHDFALPLAPGLIHLLPEVRMPRQYYMVGRRDDGHLNSSLFDILEIKLGQEMARLRRLLRSNPT